MKPPRKSDRAPGNVQSTVVDNYTPMTAHQFASPDPLKRIGNTGANAKRTREDAARDDPVRG